MPSKVNRIVNCTLILQSGPTLANILEARSLTKLVHLEKKCNAHDLSLELQIRAGVVEHLLFHRLSKALKLNSQVQVVIQASNESLAQSSKVLGVVSAVTYLAAQPRLDRAQCHSAYPQQMISRRLFSVIMTGQCPETDPEVQRPGPGA